MSDQINVNAIADTLNSKVQLPDGVGQDAVDFVVASQLPTAENNYTWYRLYKSGWVEQGGETTSASETIVLPKEMLSTNYTVMATVLTTSPTTSYYATKISSRTTSGFTATGNAIGCMWEVKGMSAQGGNQ